MNQRDKSKLTDAYNKFILTIDEETGINHNIRLILIANFTDLVNATFPAKKGIIQKLMGD